MVRVEGMGDHIEKGGKGEEWGEENILEYEMLR